MKRMKKADKILLGGVLLFGAVLGVCLALFSRGGTTVQVRVAGAVVAEYALNKPGTYVIEGADGGTNTLVIADGVAYIESASCPDGLCVGMGSISRGGQSIICLPNQVVVQVMADDEAEDDTGVDVVAG